MIIKSYEVKNNLENFLKYSLFLLYGENVGLKKDIRNLIKQKLKQKKSNLDFLVLHENEIFDNEQNFYNLI